MANHGIDPRVTDGAEPRLPNSQELHEEDPELERDYLILAQWLIDVYRELHGEKAATSRKAEFDSLQPPPTM